MEGGSDEEDRRSIVQKNIYLQPVASVTSEVTKNEMHNKSCSAIVDCLLLSFICLSNEERTDNLNIL
jgi:hypothetical protein